jgi:glutathione S-transferase
MLRIWGRLSSVNVQKVVWCAAELGLAFERTDVGGSFGGTDKPEFLAMNPTALVPVIEHDGFVLTESNAIVRYLCAHERSALFPEAVHDRADIDRWMEWQSTNWTPAMGPAFWQLVRTPEGERDAAALQGSMARSEKLAAVLDAHLARRRFVASDHFTAADIVIGCATHRWLNLPTARQPRPHLERWYGELRSRPASVPVTSQVPIT